MPKHETVAMGDSNPGSLDCESGTTTELPRCTSKCNEKVIIEEGSLTSWAVIPVWTWLSHCSVGSIGKREGRRVATLAQEPRRTVSSETTVRAVFT